jgi:hypothetical protein
VAVRLTKMQFAQRKVLAERRFMKRQLDNPYNTDELTEQEMVELRSYLDAVLDGKETT